MKRISRVVSCLLVFGFLIGIGANLYGLSGEEGVKTELVTRRLNYLNEHSARTILKKYLSPVGEITGVRESNMLIIEDVPAVVKKLMGIIDVIDVKPLDLRFTVNLILGSKVPIGKGGMDPELRKDPLLKELQGLLNYNFFKSLDASILKVQDNGYSSHRIGPDLQLSMEPHLTKEDIQVKLRLLRERGFVEDGKAIKSVLVDTKLSLKDKERTVVGVSKLDGDNKALILIISAKILK
jgi:hypothetical protein